MSEITKLYENAGLSNMWVQRYNDGYYEHERYYNSYKEMISRMMKINDWTLTEAQETAKKECKKEHRPFTAEKQIDLIKWLVRHRFNFMVYELRDNDFTFEVINKRLKQTSQFVSLSENNFEEGLAKVLNCFWQDLTKEEKQQIKEILE